MTQLLLYEIQFSIHSSLHKPFVALFCFSQISLLASCLDSVGLNKTAYFCGGWRRKERRKSFIKKITDCSVLKYQARLDKATTVFVQYLTAGIILGLSKHLSE